MGSVSFPNIYSFDEESVIESLSGLKLTYLLGPDGVPAHILGTVLLIDLYIQWTSEGRPFSIYLEEYDDNSISRITDPIFGEDPKVGEETVDGLSLFNARSLISPFQQGFLKGRSTIISSGVILSVPGLM